MLQRWGRKGSRVEQGEGIRYRRKGREASNISTTTLLLERRVKKGSWL